MDERTLNDLLECSVCLERLGANSKVLPCQHTFCRKCLEEIITSHSELRCPECRILVDVEINELPPNVLLIRLLEGIKSAAQSHTRNSSQASKTSLNDSSTHSQNQIQETVPSNQDNLHRTEQQAASVQNNEFLNGASLKQQHHFQATRTRTTTATTTNSSNNNGNKKQIVQTSQTIPHAMALYDYESTEMGSDLIFKKGDKVILRRRIDENWFVGECNGREGVFPINYVQVIVPISQPQCTALYDFFMGPNDEEGCLAFKKNTIVNVIRRVDQNWAEGRIGSNIGIFPIAFVEMNSLAKLLMDTSPKTVTMQRNLPPPPNEMHPDHLASSSIGPKSIKTHAEPSPHLSSSLSTKVKQELPIVSDADNPNVTKSVNHNRNRRSGDILAVQNEKIKPSQRCKQNSTPSNTVVALYSYKPQKSDELELKKGSIYIVKERCQDGWFRGVNRSQKFGVFPGNYVMEVSENTSEASIAGNNLNNSMFTKNLPPELPTRSSGSASSVWSKPIGQHVEALFGRTNSSSTVSLIKKITNIKRSKSPNQSAPTYSMDNPVFEDNSEGFTNPYSLSKRNTTFSAQPLHVRSGSCPSKLTTQTDLNIGFTAPNTIKMETFRSHRVKPHKERSSLHAVSFGAATQKTTESTYHKKSHSLDAATISAQICGGSSEITNGKRRSYTNNEKYKCVVSYPPNSEFELEMTVGDTIYVHKKRGNGWYKGTHAQTGKVGLFPSSFVEPYHA